MESSAYLAGRAITNPSYFYKPDSCDLMVDASKMKANDFYFMIFRSNGPPIFNKRFIAKQNPPKTQQFTPTGLKCVKMGNEWQWQYFEGKITNVKFALQPNECGCNSRIFDGKSLYGSCDQFQLTCDSTSKTFLPRALESANSRTLYLGHTRNQEFNDMTCVNKKWYLNSFAPIFPGFPCADPKKHYEQEATPRTFPCNCASMETLSPAESLFTYWLPLLDPKKKVSSYTFVSGKKATYATATCRATIQCRVDETIVLFSDFDPLVFPHGELPTIVCKASPLSRNANPKLNSYFWYVDGTQLSYPVFGCIPSCKCKFARLHPNNIERLVGKSSFYPLVKDRPYQPPAETRKNLTVCATTVGCPKTHTLIVFDTLQTTLYPTGSLTAKCEASGKWTVNGGADNGVFDQIYALCVDFRD